MLILLATNYTKIGPNIRVIEKQTIAKKTTGISTFAILFHLTLFSSIYYSLLSLFDHSIFKQ